MLYGTNGSLVGRKSYFEDQWANFRADLRAKDDEGWTDMELVGVGDDGDFCSIKVHRAVVLPWLRSVLSPLDQDSPTVVFPDTSVSALQAMVTLFYEGSIITSQLITSEVLATMKNLGIDPDKFSKKLITISEPRVSLEQLSPVITREIKMTRKKEVSKKSGSLEDGLLYSSGRKRRSCVKLGGDEEGRDTEGEKGNKRRKKTRESSHMVLRSRQNAAKHFITDDSKEKASKDAETSFGFNNNENDGEENVNEATGASEASEASEDELDLRLELDEEELLALQDEARE